MPTSCAMMPEEGIELKRLFKGKNFPDLLIEQIEVSHNLLRSSGLHNLLGYKGISKFSKNWVCSNKKRVYYTVKKQNKQLTGPKGQ